MKKILSLLLALPLIIALAACGSPMERYTQHERYPFSGVYVGQSALPVEQDNLVYLTNPVLEQAVVKSAEQQGDLPIYAPEKLSGMAT